MSKEIEISFQSSILFIKTWYLYLRSKWILIIVISVLFGIAGLLSSYFDEPVYTAELTFTTDNEGSGNLSAYSGIAAQFGLDLGAGSSNAFEGENLMHLMSSQNLIQQTLFSTVNINNQKYLLINYYSEVSGLSKALKNSNGTNVQSITFSNEYQPYNRQRDSIIKKIVGNISSSLTIERIDKRSDIISVTFREKDELFTKVFVEELVQKVIQYYTDYKVKKARQNVEILKRQTDSVRNMLSGNIVDIAVASDLNVNPLRQVTRTSVQRTQVDAQVNGALYTELVKNLELSKLSLRKETPLIQIIDIPILPLEKKKMGKLKGIVIFGFIGFLLACIFLIIKKLVIYANTASTL